MSRPLKLILFTCLALIITTSLAPAQERTVEPVVQTAAWSHTSPPLTEMTPIPPGEPLHEIKNFRFPMFIDPNVQKPAVDPVLQDWEGTRPWGQREMPINYAGIGANGSAPGDPYGDVGPNHYIQMVNTLFAIWDKEGNLLYGPVQNRTLWSGVGGPCDTENDGDPIVLYDHLADRWMLSQFAVTAGEEGQDDYYECIAVSATSDPLGEWHRYAFSYGDVFPDYPKFGVWPDGYYMSANEFRGNYGTGATVFEREAMLNGDPEARMVYFSYSGMYGLIPADLDGPPPPDGAPMPFARLTISGIQMWELTVDWDNTDQSSFIQTQMIDPAPYDIWLCGGDRDCIPQPGTNSGLDAISDRLMSRMPYRNFGDYEVLLANHSVDVGGNHAGVRWYEIRRDTGDWDIYQESTYAPDDDHRWMGSIAMDGQGNISLLYSVSGTNTYPSIRYTGRLADDPLNQMTYTEITMAAGGGYQSGTYNRWGDYCNLSVDPVDDATFWGTHQYIAETGSFNWQSRIAAYDLGPIILPDFEVDLETGHAPHVVQFTDLSIAHPGLTEWAWDFDDDGQVDSTEPNPAWTYQEPGHYRVNLEASNGLITRSIEKEAYVRVFDGESALQFDGQESMVTCYSNNTTTLTDSFTVEAWIHPIGWGEVGATGFGRIMDKVRMAVYIYGEGTQLNDHSLVLQLSTDGSAIALYNTPENTIQLDTWQHIAASYDGVSNDIQLYVNGQPQALTNVGGVASGPLLENLPYDITIGNSEGRGHTFEGILDEVRLWGSIRTAEEIQTYMDDIMPTPQMGLIGYWQMNEGNGDQIADQSGNSNAGMIDRTAWVEGRFTTLAIEDAPEPETRVLPLLLSQNYPNPFNPSTTIAYRLPSKQALTLRIYNTAGQLVKTVVDGAQSAGAHEVQWDGTNDAGQPVTSGLYFYQLNTADQSLSRRMVLLR